MQPLVAYQLCGCVQMPRALQAISSLSAVRCPQGSAPWTARSLCQTSLGGTSCRTSYARCCGWRPTGSMTYAAGWTFKTPIVRRLRHRYIPTWRCAVHAFRLANLATIDLAEGYRSLCVDYCMQCSNNIGCSFQTKQREREGSSGRSTGCKACLIN